MTLSIDLLEQSFAKVQPQADQLGAYFYETLFKDYPAAQALFTNTDMAAQQRHLVNALALVIENLRQPEALSAALQQLGMRHVGYGAVQEHYPLVGATLLKTLKAFLKEDWTLEVEQAWTEAYQTIAAIMQQGAVG